MNNMKGHGALKEQPGVQGQGDNWPSFTQGLGREGWQVSEGTL